MKKKMARASSLRIRFFLFNIWYKCVLSYIRNNCKGIDLANKICDFLFKCVIENENLTNRFVSACFSSSKVTVRNNGFGVGSNVFSLAVMEAI